MLAAAGTCFGLSLGGRISVPFGDPVSSISDHLFAVATERRGGAAAPARPINTFHPLLWWLGPKMYVTRSDRETNSGTSAERRGCLPTAAAESTEVSLRVWQPLCIRQTDRHKGSRAERRGEMALVTPSAALSQVLSISNPPGLQLHRPI